MKNFFLVSILILTSVVLGHGNSESLNSCAFDLASMNSECKEEWKVKRNLIFEVNVKWVHKKYSNKSFLQEYLKYCYISDYTMQELRAKANLHNIFITFNTTSKIPIKRMAVYLEDAVDAEVLIINCRNFHRPDNNESNWAFGLCSKIGGGYKLKRWSEFIGEFVYYNA